MRYHDIYTFCHYFKIRFTNQVVPTKMKLKYKSFNELNPVTEEKQINEPDQLTEEINADQPNLLKPVRPVGRPRLVRLPRLVGQPIVSQTSLGTKTTKDIHAPITEALVSQANQASYFQTKQRDASQISYSPWVSTSRTFRGYQINFLKYPKSIKLRDPVYVRKSKFSYHVKDISDRNYDLLNVALQEVGTRPDGKLSEHREQYFRSDDGLKFRDFMGHEKPAMDISNYTMAFIKICVQGRKERDGKNYPIWKLSEIRCI